MLSNIARRMHRGGVQTAKRAAAGGSSLRVLANAAPAAAARSRVHTSALLQQETTSSGQAESVGVEQGGQPQGQGQGQQTQSQQRGQQHVQQGGQHTRRGVRRRGGGGMGRPRNVGDEFDMFRNQINRMMSEFDESVFGGRMSPFGGGGPGLFGLLPMSPFGLGNRGRFDMPLLGGGGGWGTDLMDRGTAPLLDTGEEAEDVLGDENALALQPATSALDVMRGAPAPPVMRIDVEDLKDKYAVTAEVPGFKKEDLHVRIDNGILTIDAKHRESKKHEDPSRRFIRTERIVQSARRQLRLSTDVDQTPGKVKAKYQDGVLKIDIPKLESGKGAGMVEIDAESGPEESQQTTPRGMSE